MFERTIVTLIPKYRTIHIILWNNRRTTIATHLYETPLLHLQNNSDPIHHASSQKVLMIMLYMSGEGTQVIVTEYSVPT